MSSATVIRSTRAEPWRQHRLLVPCRQLCAVCHLETLALCTRVCIVTFPLELSCIAIGIRANVARSHGPWARLVTRSPGLSPIVSRGPRQARPRGCELARGGSAGAHPATILGPWPWIRGVWRRQAPLRQAQGDLALTGPGAEPPSGGVARWQGHRLDVPSITTASRGGFPSRQRFTPTSPRRLPARQIRR